MGMGEHLPLLTIVVVMCNTVPKLAISMFPHCWRECLAGWCPHCIHRGPNKWRAEGQRCVWFRQKLPDRRLRIRFGVTTHRTCGWHYGRLKDTETGSEHTLDISLRATDGVVDRRLKLGDLVYKVALDLDEGRETGVAASHKLLQVVKVLFPRRIQHGNPLVKLGGDRGDEIWIDGVRKHR
jgi:hypothetical protein